MQTINCILDECRKIITNPYEMLKGEKCFGYHCIFAPYELIHAAGFIPLRLFATNRGANFSERYFHSRTCEFARNLLEDFLAGQLNFLEGCLFAHCCDVLHALLKTVTGRLRNILYINVPYGTASRTARRFLYDELKRFKSWLETTYGRRINNQDLRRSLSLYRENHKLLQELSRFTKEGNLSGSEMFLIQKAGYYMRKEEHNRMLKVCLQSLEEHERKGFSEETGAKVLVSGFINAEIELLRFIEECGAWIVDDDLCGFSRAIANDTSNGFFHDPVRRIAQRCLKRLCPQKINNGKARYTMLKKRYESSGAKAIIFFVYPFCDAQSVEYAWLKKRFSEEGIKTLKIEPSAQLIESGQIMTRIKAFLEMISQRRSRV